MLERAVGSRQPDESALPKKTLRSPYVVGLFSFLICTAAMAVAFLYFDVPVARRMYGVLGPAQTLASGFASAGLLSVEGGIALALLVNRITRGHLSPFREATVLACLTSICAYAVNDNAFKRFFGVPNPATVLHGARHAFHFLAGSSNSSFPSGHMVLAGAFAGVFLRLYRVSRWPLSFLLLIAAVLLIVGDWHFISDVIAGTFVGVWAGLLAGEVWLVHSR